MLKQLLQRRNKNWRNALSIINRLEVLSPAGDYERLISAIDYGADAVYLGRKEFGMRASPLNFSYDELKSAVEIAHKKVLRFI